MRTVSVWLVLLAVGLTASCSRDTSSGAVPAGGCDKTLTLPQGFCAIIFADNVGPARDIVVRRNGDVIVGVLDQRHEPGGIVALRDADHDGRAELSKRWTATTSGV